MRLALALALVATSALAGPITENHQQALVTAAQPGAVVQVPPGSYPESYIRPRVVTPPIILKATPGVIYNGLVIQGGGGLGFVGGEAVVSPHQGAAVIVQGADRISFDGMSVHGVSVNAGLGVRVLDSTNVSVANSDFSTMSGAMAIARSSSVSVLNNKIHDIEVDGIQSAAVSTVTYSGNAFTNFYPSPGDHSDAIQFVGVSATAPSHDITITDNTYVRGKGQNIQGVFMGNEGGQRYANVQVRGNAFEGNGFHGISVYSADGLTIAGNKVWGYTDFGSWILVDHATAAKVTDNSATSFNLNNANVGLVAANNITVPQLPIGDTSVLGAPPVVITPPVPDPRDAQIAALTARLAADDAALAAARAQAAGLATQLSASQAVVASDEARLAAVRQAVAP